MSDSARDLERLSADEKRRLLAEVLRKRADGPRDGPLSDGQERLWRLSGLHPESPLYHVSVGYRLVGPLDREALVRAVRCIAERHEVLRTSFPRAGGRPVQRVAERTSPAITVDELGDLAEPDRTRTLHRLAEEQARRPFDLEGSPPWRVGLLGCTDDDHLLVVTMHHIVSDGWSFSVFCREFAALYEAFARGGSPSLPILPIQYAEFARRRRQWLSGPAAEEQAAYWRAHLAGDVPTLRLPNDRPSALAATHRGGARPFSLPADLAAAIEDLGRREGATPFMILLAGFQALLHRHTGQEDLVIGSPVTGRHRSQSRDLIGYFNNILAMRFDLSGDPDFLELVRRTRRVALDAFRHQDVPLQRVADTPALRRVPLNRVLFSLDMPWPPALILPGLEVASHAVETGTSDFDLSVSMWEEGGRLDGTARYKSELFEEAQVDRLIERYRTLLDDLTSHPERPLSARPRHAGANRPVEDAAGARPAGPGPDGEPDLMPRTPLELRVARVWEEVLGHAPIGVEDDLLGLGATSLAVARLAERVGEEFGLDLTLTALFQAGTVARVAALLRDHDPSRPPSSLAPIQPRGDRPPLFLCEGVGLYHPLARYLGEDQPVFGLVTEAFGDYPRVEDLAAHYVAEVRAVQPSGPYFLGGASFGGLVAFEMAQQLRAGGQDVAFLALFDTPSPWAATPKRFHGKVLGHLRNTLEFGLPYVRKKVSGLTRRLRERFSGRVEDPGPARSRLLEDPGRLRSRFRASAEAYRPGPYAGRITLFALARRDGMADSLFDPAVVEIDPHLGWGRVAAGGLECHELRGEHVTIFREPFVADLGAKLRDGLDRARTGHPGERPATPSESRGAIAIEAAS